MKKIRRLKSINQLKIEYFHHYDKDGDLHFEKCTHYISREMKKFFGKEVTVVENKNLTVYRIEEHGGGYPKEWFTDTDFFSIEDFSL